MKNFLPAVRLTLSAVKDRLLNKMLTTLFLSYGKYNYFRFGRSCCRFRPSVIVKVIWAMGIYMRSTVPGVLSVDRMHNSMEDIMTQFSSVMTLRPTICYRNCINNLKQ